MTVAHAKAPVTKADRESVMTKRTRFTLLRRPQASQSVRIPIKPLVFMDAMLAARRRGFGKTRLRGY